MTQPHVDSPVEAALRALRNCVNTSPVSAYLQAEKARWLRCCAAMDAADDAEQGVKAYQSAPDFNGFDGGYLYVYGLMQCLYVQQDAIRTLFDCARGIVDANGKLKHEFAFEDYPDMARVRRIRNEAFGHPAAGDKEPVVHFVTRIELSKDSFHYGGASIADEVQPDRWETIRTGELIEAQKGDALRALENLSIRLNGYRQEYEGRLRNSGIEKVLGGEVGDLASQLRSHLANSALAMSTAGKLLAAVQRYCQVLRDAGSHPDHYPGIGPEVTEVRSSLLSLRELLGRPKPDMDEACELAADIERGVGQLRDCALELAEPESLADETTPTRSNMNITILWSGADVTDE